MKSHDLLVDYGKSWQKVRKCFKILIDTSSSMINDSFPIPLVTKSGLVAYRKIKGEFSF